MSPEHRILTTEERDELELTALVRHRLEAHFRDLEQQHETAALGMWVFLATEVMFFGALFVGLGAYTYVHHEAFEKTSEKLNWIIGGLNTVVLLTSSLFMVLSVHFARLGNRRLLVLFLILTATLGLLFLCLKGFEYYTDYRDNLIPGWRFDEQEWVAPRFQTGPPPREQKADLNPEQVQQVKLFLLYYWTMTGLHGLHVTIGILVVALMAYLSWRGHFSPVYYSPVDVTALYWHFVDLVWIFLFPMLYLIGWHNGNDPSTFHF
jgi:cytochrome c oxidase subunit 3